MNEVIVIVISSMISSLVAILVSYFTTKITFKSNIKVRIIEKRELIYLEFYEHLCKMLSERTLVLQEEYFKEMESFVARLKLFASDQVYSETKKITSWIYQLNREYKKEYQRLNPHENNAFVEEIYDDETDEVWEAIFVPDWALKEFLGAIHQVEFKLTPKLREVKTKLEPLCRAMRKDMGSELK